MITWVFGALCSFTSNAYNCYCVRQRNDELHFEESAILYPKEFDRKNVIFKYFFKNKKCQRSLKRSLILCTHGLSTLPPLYKRIPFCFTRVSWKQCYRSIMVARRWFFLVYLSVIIIHRIDKYMNIFILIVLIMEIWLMFILLFAKNLRNLKTYWSRVSRR